MTDHLEAILENAVFFDGVHHCRWCDATNNRSEVHREGCLIAVAKEARAQAAESRGFEVGVTQLRDITALAAKFGAEDISLLRTEGEEIIARLDQLEQVEAELAAVEAQRDLIKEELESEQFAHERAQVELMRHHATAASETLLDAPYFEECDTEVSWLNAQRQIEAADRGRLRHALRAALEEMRDPDPDVYQLCWQALRPSNEPSSGR